jgi:site-specific DNA recombinase
LQRNAPEHYFPLAETKSNATKHYMRAIAYCRVSTAGQEAEGVSLEMQKERISAWCVANGFALDAVFVEAMSGGRANNRQELQKALALACKKKAVLVVYSLSRLARSVKDTLLITEQLERSGAALASLSERLDTSSAVGKMVFRILSTLNEFERDQISERTEHALGFLRKANRRISRKIPFGYDLNDDGETIEANPKEQAVIQKIAELRRAGASYREIARKLTVAKVQTKEGRKWYPATIRGILNRHGKIADESKGNRVALRHDHRSERMAG